MGYLQHLLCGILLAAAVSSCSTDQEEIVSTGTLKGRWLLDGASYRFYNTDKQLIREATPDSKDKLADKSYMVVSDTLIQFTQAAGSPTDNLLIKPSTYELHGDTIQFAGNSYSVIEKLTPHSLVIRTEDNTLEATPTVVIHYYLSR